MPAKSRFEKYSPRKRSAGTLAWQGSPATASQESWATASPSFSKYSTRTACEPAARLASKL